MVPVPTLKSLVLVPVPDPTFLHIWTIKSQFFNQKIEFFLAFLLSKLF
jgi:hypothetical protein